jgi:hypothetical protein
MKINFMNCFFNSVKSRTFIYSSIHLILICTTLFNLSFAQAQTNNPIANPKAVIINDDVRFTILTSQLIRLEWSENKIFEDHASLVFINRYLPVPEFEVDENNRWLTIQTERLQLKYKLNSGSFNEDNLQISFQLNDSVKIWKPGMRDTGNLLGTTRTLDGVDGSTPLEDGLLSRDGWTLIDDSERPLFDGSNWNWAISRPEGKKQDWYFFGYGHDYKKELYDFTQIAGKIPLPPRFAFGTWWSRYWNYTDSELEDLANQFHTYSVPLSVLVVDMDWHKTYQEKMDWKKLDQAGMTMGWTGYTWDNNYFPDPQKFLDWTEKENLKVTLNLHPAAGIQTYEDVYKVMAKAMGVDPETKKYIPFDITDKKFAKNYFDLVIHPFEKEGVDFWWLDWQQWHTTSIPGVTPTFWINYVFFSDMEREGKRPLLFHRWGGLGNHRYQIGFSGDTYCTWKSLAFQPFFTSTASNVGFGYWSHDIGGHMPGPTAPELYTRWIQFGVFSPILRTHASKNSLAERRIWAYPYKYFKVMREEFLLRYSLIPYIYTYSREAYDTGISLCRPMFYDYPENDKAYKFKDEYMFGDNILVSPVTVPIDPSNLLAEKEIWLPDGEWYEWFTGTMLKGTAVVKRYFTLDEIPAYIKAGAIIPMQLPQDGTNNFVNPLVLTIFPGDSGTAEVYEDTGNDLGYKQNEFAITKVSQKHENNNEQLIEIFPAEGKYNGMPERRAYKVILPGVLPPEKIICNGKELNYEYDGEKLTAFATSPEFNISDKVEIEITYPVQNLSNIVNGFTGKLERIKKVKELIHSQQGMWNVSMIIAAAQTGRRISLNPENVINELKGFDKNIVQIKNKIESLELEPEVKERCLSHIKDILDETK